MMLLLAVKSLRPVVGRVWQGACMVADDPVARRNEPVRLVPHDPAWAARFSEEADLLQATIGPWVTGGIHHVGSTAIPGLDAKPIIDTAVGVESLEASRPCIGLLSKIEYLYSPYLEEVMHWFCKPDPAKRTHHLHLILTGSVRSRTGASSATICGPTRSTPLSTGISSGALRPSTPRTERLTPAQRPTSSRPQQRQLTLGVASRTRPQGLQGPGSMRAAAGVSSLGAEE